MLPIYFAFRAFDISNIVPSSSYTPSTVPQKRPNQLITEGVIGTDRLALPLAY